MAYVKMDPLQKELNKIDKSDVDALAEKLARAKLENRDLRERINYWKNQCSNLDDSLELNKSELLKLETMLEFAKFDLKKLVVEYNDCKCYHCDYFTFWDNGCEYSHRINDACCHGSAELSQEIFKSTKVISVLDFRIDRNGLFAIANDGDTVEFFDATRVTDHKTGRCYYAKKEEGENT